MIVLLAGPANAVANVEVIKESECAVSVTIMMYTLLL